MYLVYDNHVPASKQGYPKYVTWTTHKFPTFSEAIAYAREWLGEWNTIPEEVEETSYYSVTYGYGDLLEVIKEDS